MTLPKITLTGLPNAGKTSIIRLLREQFGTVFSSISTKIQGHDFMEFLGTSMSLVYHEDSIDRNGNLNSNMQFMLKQTKYLLYLIDIQQKARYQEALQYLKKILSFMFKHHTKFHVTILFHKFDKKLNHVATKNMHTLLYQIIDYVGGQSIPVYHFKTSYYNPFSILRALSLPIFNHEGIISPINCILENFAKKYELKMIALYSHTPIELGAYYQDTLKYLQMNRDNKQFIQNHQEDFNAIPELQQKFDPYSTMHYIKFYIPFGYGDLPLYLAWCEPDTYSQEFENKLFELQENLKDLLKKAPLPPGSVTSTIG